MFNNLENMLGTKEEFEGSRKFVSNCCGASMSGIVRDIEICPDCHEHCGVIQEDEE